MSDCNDVTTMGFASAVPDNYISKWIVNRIFPTKGDPAGRMLLAQHGLCKIEASLGI